MGVQRATLFLSLLIANFTNGRKQIIGNRRILYICSVQGETWVQQKKNLNLQDSHAGKSVHQSGASYLGSKRRGLDSLKMRGKELTIRVTGIRGN